MGEFHPRDEMEKKVVEQEARSSGLAGYALIKYGAIVIIVFAVLWFIGNFLIPLVAAAEPTPSTPIAAPKSGG